MKQSIYILRHSPKLRPSLGQRGSNLIFWEKKKERIKIKEKKEEEEIRELDQLQNRSSAQIHDAGHVPREPPRVVLFRGYHFHRSLQLFRRRTAEERNRATLREEMLQRDNIRAARSNASHTDARLLMSRLITSNNDPLYATFISYQAWCYTLRGP